MPVRNVKISDVSMDYFLRGTEAARPQVRMVHTDGTGSIT